MKTIELRNGHCYEIAPEADLPLTPELPFHETSAKAAAMMDRVGSYAVYNAPGRSASAQIAREAAWIAESCYGFTPVVLDCNRQGASESSIENAFNIIDHHLGRHKESAVVALAGFDNLTHAGSVEPTKAQLLAGRNILKLLHSRTKLFAVSALHRSEISAKLSLNTLIDEFHDKEAFNQDLPINATLVSPMQESRGQLAHV